MRGQATYPNQWDFNTATPLPISKIIDNHPEQSRDDKWEIDVFTCDGLYIKYWLYMPADATLEVLKNPGDIVIASGPPAAMMGRAPYARLTEAA
ncbi:MAG TPA: hypothetical protein PKD55_05415, partial [Bellilinea sp.]|nr:hypothetical protein [Bellilinea sp.]